MASADDEFLPYLVCRRQAEQLECALWTLAEGPRTLALFLTEESAQRYLEQTESHDGWQIFQPQRDDLLKILEITVEAGVVYAVLDPHQGEARRIFDLKQVLRSAQS